MADTDPVDSRVEIFTGLSRKSKCPLLTCAVGHTYFPLFAVRVLTSADVSTVVSELIPVAEKWHEIGTQFRLSAEFLDGLKVKGQDAKTSLHDMVTKWVGGGSPRPTWKALRNALKHENVGEEAMANKLTNKYSIEDKNSGKQCPPIGVHYLEYPLPPF